MAEALGDAEIEALTHPEVFCERWLGVKPYSKQCAALRALRAPGARVALKSCNGGGKTSVVAVAATLWHLSLWPRGRIIHTSSSNRQIIDQCWPVLRSHAPKFPHLLFRAHPRIDVSGEPLGFYRGAATDDPGLFEGAHVTGPDGPLLVIYDECKSVSDLIFQAGARFGATRELYLSSPGAPEGEFYRLFTSKRKVMSALISQTADECAAAGHPTITRDWIARMREEWRGCPELVASMLDAEFLLQTEDAVFSALYLDRCLAEPPKWQDGEEHLFCDFGAGGDENVLARRRGNRVEIVDAWRETDTMKAVDHFVSLFCRCGLGPKDAWKITGDAGGLGKVMIDALARNGWRISSDLMQAAPADRVHYRHRVAEVWVEGSKKVMNLQVVLPPDEELRRQMLARKKVSRGGQPVQLESKEDMRARGVPSPDRADAVLGCMMPCPGAVGRGRATSEPEVTSWRDYEEQRDRESRGTVSVGADDGSW